MEALRLFSGATSDSKIFAVPRLHAKVYLRDTDLAIITSANLTPSGLDFNYEYGVGLSDTKMVKRIRQDIEAYSRVGSKMSSELLAEIDLISAELAMEFQKDAAVSQI